MGAVDTTYTFTATDTITSTKMNNIIDQTTITTDAIIGTTLEVASGKLKVRAQGITSNELATNAVTATNITNGSVTPAKLSSGGPSWSGTGAGGVFGVPQTGLEFGTGHTQDYNCFIDLHAAATPTDFETRIVRDGGANGNLRVLNNGTGNIQLTSAGGVVMNNAGGVTFGTANMPTPSGSAPIYGTRAWANFNGQANSDLSGTYTRTASTTVTITATAHGLIVGNRVFLDYTVGTGTAPFDGVYEVATVTDANTFTVVSSVNTSSTGSVALRRKTIRGYGNISCVSAAMASPVVPPTSNQALDSGYFILNFSTALPNLNFALSGTVNESGLLTSSSGNKSLSGFAFNEKCAYISTLSFGSTNVNCLHNNVTVIG